MIELQLLIVSGGSSFEPMSNNSDALVFIDFRIVKEILDGVKPIKTILDVKVTVKMGEVKLNIVVAMLVRAGTELGSYYLKDQLLKCSYF